MAMQTDRSRPDLDYSNSESRGVGVILHNVSWQRYEALLELLGDDYPGLRLTYLKGALQIMATSAYHEQLKTTIARLLEMWAVERDVHLNGHGAATFRKQAKERGLEPDECYVLGDLVDCPISPSRLCTRMGVSTSSTSTLVSGSKRFGGGRRIG
jgi:Uma2 family endonuclease